MEKGDESGLAGWYGKLPSLGDFASRRLDHGFIEAWDHWLAEGLAAWREREPDAWLDRYLSGPSWRFILAPGSLDQSAWAGVLMPSVDRVGRYFPLTLALPLPGLPPSEDAAGALLVWLQQLDDIAVDALQEDWPIEQLEAELARLGKPADSAPADAHNIESVLTLQPGQVLWICTDATGQPQCRAGGGLPRDEAFAQLLGAPTINE